MIIYKVKVWSDNYDVYEESEHLSTTEIYFMNKEKAIRRLEQLIEQGKKYFTNTSFIKYPNGNGRFPLAHYDRNYGIIEIETED